MSSNVMNWHTKHRRLVGKRRSMKKVLHSRWESGSSYRSARFLWLRVTCQWMIATEIWIKELDNSRTTKTQTQCRSCNLQGLLLTQSIFGQWTEGLCREAAITVPVYCSNLTAQLSGIQRTAYGWAREILSHEEGTRTQRRNETSLF